MSFRSLNLVGAPDRPVRFPSRSPGHTSFEMHDPALGMMSDFAVIAPVVCSAQVKIDAALAHMKAAGVNALIVVRHGCMVGLVTASDVQGEKPVQFLNGGGCVHERCHHEDIEVADIMTPVEQLEAVSLCALDTARIGDLVETFRISGHAHILVIESDGTDTGTAIRGLLSWSEIERHLGVELGRSRSASLNRNAAQATGL